MATRQNSSSGKPKSPRIQVVLPEDLCKKLSVLAEQQSRTVSNMAKVLIQEGIDRFENSQTPKASSNQLPTHMNSNKLLSSLENQSARRLRGAPKRFKILKP